LTELNEPLLLELVEDGIRGLRLDLEDCVVVEVFRLVGLSERNPEDFVCILLLLDECELR
jgi:hypothetical protein